MAWLDELPSPPRLCGVMRGLAMLEAILSPEWDLRYHSFDPSWGEGEMLGSVRDGEGDELFVLFTGGDTFLKLFEHERDGGVLSTTLRDVPAGLCGAFAEPAFSPELPGTFAWWRPGDVEWRSAGSDTTNGGGELARMLNGDPARFVAFAREYHEQDVNARAVRMLLDGVPLTRELVAGVDPAADHARVRREAGEIGYPTA